MRDETSEDSQLGYKVSLQSRQECSFGLILTCQANGMFFKFNRAKTMAIILQMPNLATRPYGSRKAIAVKATASVNTKLAKGNMLGGLIGQSISQTYKPDLLL